MTDTTLKNLANITSSTSLSDTDITYIVRPSTDTDYKASLGDLKTYIAPSKPQIVATHNAISTGFHTGDQSSRTDLQDQHRTSHYIGCQDVDQLQMGTCAYYMPASDNTGEKLMTNSFGWEAAIEITDPALTRSMFVGESKIANVDAQCPLVLTKPVGFTIEAGSKIYSRQGFTISNTAHAFLGYTANRMMESVNYRSPSSASQIGNTGALSLPSGGTNSFRGALPTVIIGIPKKPMASVLVIGDSISDGVGDGTTLSSRGAIGYIRRGLELVNGYSVPWHFQAVTGWAMAGQTRTLSPRMRDTWKYCTHVIFGLGWNDIATGDTLAGLQAKATAALTELKRTIGPYGKPLHVTITTITPRTTTTNSWINAGSQTPTTPFSNGNIRDQYNDWLLSLVGGSLVDDIIDLRSVTEDPADHNKWVSNGTANYATSDGIHPSSNLVTLMAPLVTSWAEKIKP